MSLFSRCVKLHVNMHEKNAHNNGVSQCTECEFGYRMLRKLRIKFFGKMGYNFNGSKLKSQSSVTNLRGVYFNRLTFRILFLLFDEAFNIKN